MVVQATFDKRCLMVEAPVELSILTTSLCTLFALANIPGNILIILAVVYDPNKNLRTPFNWLVLNLAIADLIVGTVSLTVSVDFHLKEALKIEITAEEIITLHMSYFISCTASVLSLSSLAVERYLAVRKATAYRTRVTKKRIGITVAAIWLISLGLPNIYFKVGFNTYRFIFNNTCIAIASTVATVTYIFVLRKLRGTSMDLSNPTVRATQHTTSSSSTSTEAGNRLSPGQNLSTLNASAPTSVANSSRMLEEKVTKMFIVVLIALLSCYCPAIIMVYMITFCEFCSCITLHWLRDFNFLFVLLNSNINFFCYAYYSPRFRCAFMKLLKIKQRTTGINNIEGGNEPPGQTISKKQLDTAL